jgi:outer membrane receptor protein involved in Fe transport
MPRNILEIERVLSTGGTEDDLYNDGYYVLDGSLNLVLSSNLELYGRVFNVFNTKFAGIDANDGPDVLFYNPQSLLTFRLGINYHLK